MRTSELAGRAGVNAETLRYYERRGLLERPPRTSGGYRDYPNGAVGLLRFVKRAQELGFTLDEVEELLHLNGGGPDACDAARALTATARPTSRSGSATCNGCVTPSPIWSPPAICHAPTAGARCSRPSTPVMRGTDDRRASDASARSLARAGLRQPEAAA